MERASVLTKFNKDNIAHEGIKDTVNIETIKEE